MSTPLDLHGLLTRTSRTFALAIPLLPAPLDREVALAYLLFRIADTFEDAARWPRAARIAALNDFAGLLEPGTPGTGGTANDRSVALADAWVRARPIEHEGYLDLLAQTPAVLAATDALRAEARGPVVHHTLRTARGMAGFVARGDEVGNLRLTDLADLRGYCYVVAGIVGELLTDLFLATTPELASESGVLRGNARLFGEGLQLVNILKDSADDAREGRVYLPADIPRADVLALAREDLTHAGTYVAALRRGGAAHGVVAFCGLPLLLARATLEVVEREGPGARVGRALVAEAMQKLQDALASGAPLPT